MRYTRTMLRVRRLIVGAALPLTLACSAGPRSESAYAAKVPPELRESFDLFAHRCSKCHGLGRALESGISDDDQWVNYVRRMRLQPTSGISEVDEAGILPFLRLYAARERARKAAPPLAAGTDAGSVAALPASPAKPEPDGGSAP